MHKVISLFSATAALCLLCNSAAAVDYKFAGTVTTVPSALASQFSTGQTISGTFSVTQTTFLPDHGGGPISNLSANIGGSYPFTSTGGGFDILNDFGGSTDEFKVDTNNFTGLAGPPVLGHSAEYFFLQLLYQGTSHLTSSNLLPQFVFSNPQDISGLRFDGNDALTVQFHLSDVSQIPEPSAAFLAIFSSATLAAIRRKPRRR
jgi:hypothetical protein